MNVPVKKDGFTIIEVVLVLAIAGLIFLIVFLAVPALQRSQRDTQRKNDISRFMSQINSYQANNRGAVPAATAAAIANAGGFEDNYLTPTASDVFQDPNGSNYTYTFGNGASPAAGGIRYNVNARCGNNGDIVAGTGARQVAATIGLEGGGGYCQQN